METCTERASLLLPDVCNKWSLAVLDSGAIGTPEMQTNFKYSSFNLSQCYFNNYSSYKATKEVANILLFF